MTYEFRLHSLLMADETEVAIGNLTVLLGPNNAGKSRALRDILDAITSVPTTPAVVKGVHYNKPATVAEVIAAYPLKEVATRVGQRKFRGLNPNLISEYQIEVPVEIFDDKSFDTELRRRSFEQTFSRLMVANLTTESRLVLVKRWPPFPDRPNPTEKLVNSLLYDLVYAAPATKNLLRAQLKSAFDSDVFVDYTALTDVLLRVGPDFSYVSPDPSVSHEELKAFDSIDEQGDGMRAFLGIIAAMCAINRNVWLIDEPEAFLHPPQAFRIGAFLAEQARQNRQIVVATHSVDVLRGIIHSTRNVDIVRLDRSTGTTLIRRLDANRLREIVDDPLMTSARVLDGLFYSAAVVTEADADSRFYHAVSAKRNPTLDVHFVNADNKQTVSRIIRLYKDMGVRSAGIVDIDVVNDRRELEKTLRELDVSEDVVSDCLERQIVIAKAVQEVLPDDRINAIHKSIDEISALIERGLRDAVSDKDPRRSKDGLLKKLASRFHELAEQAKPWKDLKRSGIGVLPPDAAAAFGQIAHKCGLGGLFITSVGELESMLSDYGIKHSNDKRAWITQALGIVAGLTPDDSKHPWKFMKHVHDFLSIDKTLAARASAMSGP